MRAGKLDKRVTLQSPPIGRDSHNQPTGPWVDVVTCWAAIEPLSAKERFVAGAADAEVTHRIRIRYRADVGFSAKMRVKYGARIFRVEGIRDPLEAHRELELLAVESQRRVPPQIAAALAWFRKREGIVAVNGAVSQWTDATGRGNHLLQAVGSSQPTLNANGGIVFDGTADFLETAAIAELVQPFTIALRFRHITQASGDVILEDRGGTGSIRLAQTGVTIGAMRFSTDAGVTFLSDTQPGGAMGFVIIGAAGGNGVLRVNNQAEILGPVANGNPGGLCLGSRGAAVNCANVEVDELIVWPSLLDASGRQLAAGYLEEL
jgi:SPP1 family predicted phage head-tail adaptor